LDDHQIVEGGPLAACPLVADRYKGDLMAAEEYLVARLIQNQALSVLNLKVHP
jgi:hypothetical protein